MKTTLYLRAAALSVCLLLALALAPPRARADEGMWTFNNFPSQKVQQTYGFGPAQPWLDHVRLSSLRVAEGCSASFVSPQGLVMTNHHCVVSCVEQLSTPQQNYVEAGFVAKSRGDEKKCPAFELDQLTQITDITSQIQGATAGKTGDAANKALFAAQAQAQQTCGNDPSIRCDVVSLYHGGIYNLYKYKRYTDARLVFAPEFAIGQFGGDPDNFNFPRYDFDVGLLRVYENDKPIASPDYLHWSRNGSKAGDLVFVPGNPGGTSRELTMSQLQFERDHAFPAEMPMLSEFRGQLEQYITRGPEQARTANEILFFVANQFKADYGRQGALLDTQFWDLKTSQEQKLRAAVAANPQLQAQYASAWDDISSLQVLRAQLATRYASTGGNFFFSFGLLGDAFTLVRAATERTKPNGDRLPEFTDQALVAVKEELSAPIPVHKDLEELQLAFMLTTVRRDLGADDPFVHKLLGNESPEQLAHRLVTETKLDDPKARVALYDGGEAAVNASTDPMIVLARSIDPELRASRKDHEARIDAPTRAASEKIAKARFAVYGTSVDPDATFTLRLSYGAVKGFMNNQGQDVPPYTTIGGLFARAGGGPPFQLPQSWIAAKPSLDMATPMNLSTTNDIIGGNSGSPLIDKNAGVVGLIFDGNIFSLGGDYGYDPKQNRSVAVDSRALLEGFRKVYHLDAIVDEITAAR
jgi:peptidase S46-like protein